MSTKKTCQNCEHSRVHLAPDKTMFRVCVYNPPTAVPVMQMGPHGPFTQILPAQPPVEDEGYCSKHCDGFTGVLHA